jgi:hypothetical protein
LELKLMLAVLLLPTWLTDEHAITLATWGLVAVTLLLVIATVFLCIDSWNKGNEQRDRWKRDDEQRNKDREEERARWLREDEIRLDQLSPKVAFGLDLRARANDLEPIILWCANLGSVAVHVETVSVCRVSDLGNDQVDFEFAPHQLANSGEMVRIPVPSAMLRGLLLSVDIEIWCEISSAYKRIETNRTAYSLFLADAGRISQVRLGFYEDRTVTCPSCGSTGYLSPNGLASKSELLTVISKPNVS